MSYSDDTASFMAFGRPTMDELRDNPSPKGEPCPKCNQLMFAYGYGGTARWCTKCMEWRKATIKKPMTPQEQDAETMWM
ncbi:MAG: hypothetical protein R3330_17475 [Saprospiraceae bacterium]|nr:hypothetical protein [Saprospiraceae bacterium]